MRFDLHRPCPKCPFRTDVDPYLRPARCQEIASSIAAGETFACHETTADHVDDETGEESRVETTDSRMCAGALIVMERMGQPNQIVRIAERTGVYDPAQLDMDAPVVSSFVDFVAHHADEEPSETCSVANTRCEAPAGYMVGGTVVPEASPGETHSCPGCGEPVCDECSNDKGVCAYCDEEDDHP